MTDATLSDWLEVRLTRLDGLITARILNTWADRLCRLVVMTPVLAVFVIVCAFEGIATPFLHKNPPLTKPRARPIARLQESHSLNFDSQKRL